MDDLLDEFLTETGEHLEIVDQELVRFEQEPNNQDILRNVFRLVHTIKGTCGFLGLPRLEKLAHAAENVMGHFRDGATVTPAGVTVILRTIDRLKAIIAVLGREGAEPEGGDDDLIDLLHALSEEAVRTVAPPPLTTGTLTYQVLERPLRPGEVTLDDLERAFREAEGPELAPAAPAPPLSPIAEEPLSAAMAAMPEGQPATASTGLPAFDNGSDDARGDGRGGLTQTIRVNVDTLEHLMTMVSELVLTRNQLLELARRTEDSQYKVPLQRLSHITAELQDGVMKTRMQPIGNAWAKLPRILRDLASELGKKIELVSNGADTELDRQVLELIKDPLTHMIRNSADHGIELPAERRALGKPETGTIRLAAFHEGGSITIEVSDDGRGLDFPRIRAKVIDKGLASAAEVEKMPEHQLARFIFHPGFSTARSVTAVSGRGVGMDVVKSNVDSIGGIIDVASRTGEGTTFTVKIPLTLAIVSALIVSVEEQRFAIPQVVVRELVRVKAGSSHAIERINGATVLRLRERLLPVVALNEIMRLGEDREAGDGFVVVTQIGGRQFGLLVDGVFHTEEIVVKPMSSKLRALSLFSGNTILGDGAVVLILDPNGISRQIGAVDTETEEAPDAAAEAASRLGEAVTMLVFRTGTDSLKAIPLSLVTRLEEVEAAQIERSGERPVLQYRGRLMPIVPASAEVRLRSEGLQPLIIFSDGDRTMGLAVDAIVDIVDEAFEIELSARTDTSAVGAAVIRGRATEIIDVAHYLPLAYPDWLAGAGPRRPANGEPHVLLVDSSAFFRDLLSPVLKAAGWRVTAVSGPAEALARIEATRGFDAAILDLDAPEPGGLALAAALRRHEYGVGLPLIGRITTPTAALAEAAHGLGVAEVIAKFDRRGLVQALAALHGAVRQAA